VRAGILIAFGFVIMNLLVDLTYAWFDPRIRYRRDHATSPYAPPAPAPHGQPDHPDEPRGPGAFVILSCCGRIRRASRPMTPIRRLCSSRPSRNSSGPTVRAGVLRIMYGARIALLVGFSASFAGCTLGALLGVSSAYSGGKVDLLLERLMDILLAFPQLILALAIASILGPSVRNVIIAVAIPVIPRAARVVRATALSVKEHAYVEAVHALGAVRRRVIFQHIVPNVAAPYLIMLTAQLGGAILAEAALSYLGLGTAEPTPSWGLMLSGSAPSYAEKAPWIALFPGIAISLGVFGFNLFGDSLRDALDPKLRRN
jgi:peptide/nickel transport system permease protein